MFKYNLVYGDDGAPEMDKETRLRYGETVMTHAMVFTAYDQPAAADHPVKWRVENSYAQTNGDNGCESPSVVCTPTLHRSGSLSECCAAFATNSLLAPADMVMTDSWFDEYNFQVAVDIDLLAPELTEILAQEPVVLPAWDPMGALAGGVEEVFCGSTVSSKL